MKCCLSVTPYFDQERRDDLVNPPSDACSCQEQVDELNKMLKLFKELSKQFPQLEKEIQRSQGSLAFLIEANRQLDRNMWHGVLEGIEEKVQKIWQKSEANHEGAFKLTTWLLHDLISNLYQTVLLRQLLEAEKKQNTEAKGVLEQRVKQFSNLELLKKTLRGQDQPIGFSGVHNTFYPVWFTNHFKAV